jgi:signal transduction histidine kinase
LKDISAEATQKVSAIATAKDIVIENKVDNIHLKGNETTLTELLVILLDNAIKYSESKTTIKITSYQHDNYAYIKIADQGQGIAKLDLPHIFDRFYRSDLSRSKKETNGYGLGLSIAKKIVEDHKGSIKVKSILGKGSIFTIKLPISI